MASDDMRYYETFYGLHTHDWGVTFGGFANHHKILNKNYISDAVTQNTYTDASTATDVNEFIYPHHIKKVYFIEGVIEGHITYGLVNDTGTGDITSYRVTLCKIHEDTDKDELFTTGWVTVSTTLNTTDEVVYPFWIDAWEKEKLGEKERIFIRIETVADNTVELLHGNYPSTEDMKIIVPFKL
jgi:hypothetical protein